MRVLVFDDVDENRHTFGVLEKILGDFSFIVTNSLKECERHYSSSLFDIVIVDFSSIAGKEIISKIVKRNPKQRVITLSSKIACSVELGCEHCVKSFNRRRLFKPIDFKKLLEYIKGFDTLECNYYKSFEDVKGILTEVLKSFPSYTYDEQNKSIYTLNKSSSKLSDFLKIVEILDKNCIAHHIDEYENIKID